ncbi:coiled-coil and C2 domain-containing protein 1A-like, partial [Passer montanus]|uniref:coiled-coil and C2 domain-containing protein 1A-like n=1 Tax=Passer montanus TaxID=9160 RepID=UPI00196112B2
MTVPIKNLLSLKEVFQRNTYLPLWFVTRERPRERRRERGAAAAPPARPQGPPGPPRPRPRAAPAPAGAAEGGRAGQTPRGQRHRPGPLQGSQGTPRTPTVSPKPPLLPQNPPSPRALQRLEAQLEALERGPAPDPQAEETRDPPGRDPAGKDPAGKDPAARDPAAGDPAAPSPEAPRDVREALEQRMERYRAAAGQARASGDDRKARMHERILKQYQAALRALAAGRAVDLSELPVPPGCPPIPGVEGPAEPGISGVLEDALRLTEQQQQEEEEEEEEKEGTKVQPSAAPVPPPKQPPRNSQPAPKAAGKAQQQLELLELRRRQLAQAALRAKRRHDLEGAKALLRQARAVQGLLGAARGGLPVDLAQVPEVPLDGAEFELGPAGGAPMPPEVAKTFQQLAGALKRQHEMCLTYSRQFARLGNIAETARMFPELSSSDLELGIERGRGIPVPPGVAPGDLDTFVRFEFPHPSAVSDPKTGLGPQNGPGTPKMGLGPPEMELGPQKWLGLFWGCFGVILGPLGGWFGAISLGLFWGRAPCPLTPTRRGLFRPERALGSALLRLEGLEGSCELRQQLELLDGRRRTGGLLEVWVRLREPLGPQRELEPRCERWLVLEPAPEPALAVPKPSAAAPRDGLFWGCFGVILGPLGGWFGAISLGLFWGRAPCPLTPTRRGLFRPERALGSALLRLEGLEGSCELRQQLELLDGRRRTGGLLEVWVRLREPLGPQRELEPRCERWLVLEPAPEPALAVPKPSAAAPRDGNNRPLPTLPSLNLLHFDRERLERKMAPLGRAVPPELRQQHQELQRRIQGLRARLQGGDPHFRREYAEHLQRHLRLYTEAARRLGTQGERVGETPAQPSPPSPGNPPRPPAAPPGSEGSAPKILETPKSWWSHPPKKHIFLGFSKCGRYVLSYTSSSDDFSFYLYHLYWWEFNVHSKLRLVRQVRLFQGEEIYSDLYLTVCEWPGDSDKVIVFGFNTRSAPGLLLSAMLMSDENHRDIYVSAVAVPPPRHCPACRRPPGTP